MKLSEHWLREWVNPALDTTALVHLLTQAGLEVEAIEAVAPSFSGVCVARVDTVEPHPQADRLRICRVDAGQHGSLQIVCGAANVRAGIYVPLARVGAILPGGTTINPAKLRGVESQGMLCSAKELGLAEESQGLWELDPQATPGQDLREWLILDDHAIELSITPNRGDCLSVLGLAREVAALTSMVLLDKATVTIAETAIATPAVKLESLADCAHYVGRVIQGLNPQARSPLWLQERLRRSDIRSLGPVVDVTNYVMLELGQPLHAFDKARLHGDIQVRRAQPAERLTLLNGQNVELRPDTLLITDSRGPVAMAGIMGGSESAVTDQTTEIFLESALFVPTAISGRARKYGLSSDAAHRFERGVDPQLQRRALDRATSLLLEIAGGSAGPVTQAGHPAPSHGEPILLRLARIEKLLGFTVPADRVEDMLTSLGMKLTPLAEAWQVSPPSHRYDLAIEEDLIEEVARLYGYENLEARLTTGHLLLAKAPEHQLPERRLQATLIQRGYQEVITYSFVDPQLQTHFVSDELPIDLTNPLSRELSQMRINLWPGLLQTLMHNVRRQQGRVRLFETGLIFGRQGKAVLQSKAIGGLAYGDRYPEQWGAAAKTVDFFDVKADIEALTGLILDAASFRYEAAEHAGFHPGQCARILRNDQTVGWLGCLHPQLVTRLDLSKTPVLFQLDMAIFGEARLPAFRNVSKFPSVRRDLAVIAPENLAVGEILSRIYQAAGSLLADVLTFDVYRGQGVANGSKSVAFGLIFQHESRTLADEEINSAISSVVETLKTTIGVRIRE